jgi:hypothetical protein
MVFEEQSTNTKVKCDLNKINLQVQKYIYKFFILNYILKLFSLTS